MGAEFQAASVVLPSPDLGVVALPAGWFVSIFGDHGQQCVCGALLVARVAGRGVNGDFRRGVFFARRAMENSFDCLGGVSFAPSGPVAASLAAARCFRLAHGRADGESMDTGIEYSRDLP